MSSQPLVIGVDGGGTKTVAWLARLDPGDEESILGRGQAGPGNPRAAGFLTAQQNIASAVAAAFADANLTPRPAAAACLGLAGAGRLEEQTRITAWAAQAQLASHMLVTGDAEPILAAAAADDVGIALICGTGSLAWGRNSAGQVGRCGGWGFLLGDEGSAYRIGLAGLQAAARAADGRGPGTSLVAAIQNALSVSTPEQMIDRVYAPLLAREEVAQLARVVFAEETGDAVAAQILDHAAGELVELVSTLARRLSLTARFALACAGSVLVHQSRFREQMLARLRAAALSPDVALIAEPVAGAVGLARRLAKSKASEP